MADQTNTNSGDSRNVVQTGAVTGIVNLGGTNTIEGVVIGDNATIINHGTDPKKSGRKK